MSELPDIRDILTYFSPNAVVVERQMEGVFTPWQAYTNESRNLRLARAVEEIASIETVLPEAAMALSKEVTDAYIIRCEDSSLGSGMFRVFNIRLDDGETSSWLSKPPVRSDRDDHPLLLKGPLKLADLYRRNFDGVTSMFGTGGVRPLDMLLPISHPSSDFAETAWFESVALRTDKDLVFELANNGGGVRALIDLSKDQRSVELPTLLWVDDEDGLEDMSAPLWSFIDSMTEIILTS
jgi:hypothetical protein